MKNTLVLFLLLLANGAESQQTTILNQTTLGGNAADYGQSSVYNSDGTTVIAGWTSSGISGDKTLASFGSGDIWAIKLNSDLSIAWQLAYGGTGGEGSVKIIKTSDGGYLLGSYSDSPISGNKTIADVGLGDYWVLKLDSNGAIEWQNVFGGTGEDILTSLVETSTGDYIIGGNSNSPISGNKTENAVGLNDYWIVKIDAFGNYVWDKTIGGLNTDLLFELVIDSENNILLSGSSESDISGNKTQNSFGYGDYWIVKLDQAGSIIWDKTIGGSFDDFYCRIISLGTNYYLAGDSNSDISGLKSEDSFGSVDFWLVKLDKNGNLIWDKTIGGNNFDGLNYMILTNDFQLITTGESDSDISGFKSENSIGGSTDFWIASIDTNGNFIWDKTIGGMQLDIPHTIHEKSDNNYIITGYSDSNISGDKDEVCRGWEDYWIVEISSTVGILENDFSEINIYPNPAINYFSFSENVSDVKISDLQGKIILETSTITSNTIDISDLPSGMYFVQFMFDSKIYSKKLVIH